MEWLEEQVKTCRNLCDTALVLIRVGKRELLPSILELLFLQVQDIVEENCLEGEDENNTSNH